MLELQVLDCEYSKHFQLAIHKVLLPELQRKSERIKQTEDKDIKRVHWLNVNKPYLSSVNMNRIRSTTNKPKLMYMQQQSMNRNVTNRHSIRAPRLFLYHILADSTM